MIVVPSPELLIHGKSRYYEEHTERFLELSDDLNENAQIIIDDIIDQYTKKDPFSRHFRTQKIAKADGLEISPKLATLYGNICLSMNDDESALYWYKVAASKGSANVLNTIGQLFAKGRLRQYHSPEGKFHNSQIAIRWFQRALQNGSNDSNQYIAGTYLSQNNSSSALHYFLTHYQITSSLFSKMAISSILNKNCPDGKINPICWDLSLVNDGNFPSIKNIIERSDCKCRQEWNQLLMKYRIRIFPPTNYHPTFFSINHTKNTKIGDCSRLFDIFWQFDTIQCHSDQNFYISTQNSEYKKQKNILRLTDSEFPEKEIPQIYSEISVYDFFDLGFYPISNRTHFLVQAFKFACSKFEDRNLRLASVILNKGQITKDVLYKSDLYIQKSRSKNLNDLVSCGLLASILGDEDVAKQLYFKAAQRGNIPASLLYGLNLFHSSNKEDQLAGSVFLARCMTDPIALIHIGATNDDLFYLQRASEILKISLPHEMFEWVGNCFALGIHIPRNIKAALMWYGYALHKKCENGSDTTDLIEKIKNLVGVEFAMSMFS